MKRLLLGLFVLCTFLLNTPVQAQLKLSNFGKGLQFTGKDSTYDMNLSFRMQNLHVADWDIDDGEFTDYHSAFLIRRSRLKMSGWALSPDLKFKFELGMTNRDISGGNSSEFSNTSNLILDAWVEWRFYNNFKIKFGQGKLPGNRERLISSGNLQLVDRSRLNSRFTLDRDIGIHLSHHFTIGKEFIIKEIFALTQGEGRNITAGHFDGYAYTFKVEFFPFGKFASKGDYVGGAVKVEPKPKLAVAVAYDVNKNAVRERGQKGSFITDETGTYYGEDLTTVFADLMFKYKSLSIMAEFADRKTESGESIVLDSMMNNIGTFYTGSGFNVQAGYMLKKNWEIAMRYTSISPDVDVASDENQYTLGLSKYIVGHKLKVQTDVTLIDKGVDDQSFMWRTQVDFHF
jgi:hypothetical protein